MRPPAPPLHYPLESELIASMQRYCVFASQDPSRRINVLAFDADHAALDGAEALDLPRHRVHVIATPGYLHSSGQA